MGIFELQFVSGQKRCTFKGGCDCPTRPRSVFEVSHSFAVGHRGEKENRCSKKGVFLMMTARK